MDKVFGLDIGTRNVVGTVGYRTEEEEFVVLAQYVRQHETRSMLDGQIHDIGRVGRTIGAVKAELEAQTGEPLDEVCIAAAGRVLKTVTTHVEYEYADESVVSGEDVHTLNLLGVEKAQKELMEKNDTKYKFYCVGYSVVKYYLNDEVFISIESHKANKIGEDIIVTFLPEDVVDGLYSAVGQAGLAVANMTLEPIAAINVAIPENFRMLNLALVDVGAGTSDISITREGSIIAYGMIPYAGDELTEVIVQHYLVDFKTAEAIKLASTTEEEITYEDIMSIAHTIPSKEVWELVAPVVDKITTEVADKIMELNGGKPVSACFVVGGGGKIHGFTDMLAEYMDLPKERVALRGEEVLKEVTFQQKDIKKDPLLVTPIGICLNYYEQKNNFIMVRFNGERLKLYDNNHLTIVDAALQADFPNDRIFPQRGMPINFTVNGSARIVRGEAGEPAIVTMNGRQTSLNAPLEPNSEIIIEPSTAGAAAVYTVGQLDEYSTATVTFIINGKPVVCPKFVEVNGSLEPASYEIQEGDVIETRNFYTVGQVAEFMDVEVDMDREILVNNRPADFDSLVYENFSIEWSTISYAAAGESGKESRPVPAGDAERDNKPASIEKPAEPAIEPEPASAEPETGKGSGGAERKTEAEPAAKTGIEKEAEKTPERKAEQTPAPEPEPAEEPGCTVTVNGETVVMRGKEKYIFVDIFDWITFDLNAGEGKAIVTLVNGVDAEYSQQLFEGDRIELYWKEN
ncbi:MAG: rod shape-determining protein [Muribaculaceae bacterium]|nr:rod shape-determining protein [Roseburia sp.]MCM1432110.1 rod shape-determining protein [Muribaculaceae bacterium]MCM1493977.1 rod shape-determining protein [Muribaculaceae bacterium]